MDERRTGILIGLASALLFGLGAPVSKLLLPHAGPLPLAGLLYLGGGAAFFLVRRSRTEAPLTRADAPIVAGAVLAGAALAPPLMLWGLTRVSGLTGSLLLNLEAPFTMALPMGPMAALAPITQAWKPWRSINSGRSCSVSPMAISQQATVAIAAMRLP